MKSSGVLVSGKFKIFASKVALGDLIDGSEPEIELSVLMSVRNAESTLRHAVLSTLQAMPRNSELIVFFNGCSDRSLAIAEKISDNRLRLIVSAENLGLPVALNALLKEARGRLVARMDADDICLPGRFICQVRALVSQDADFVFSNAILFGPNVAPLGVLPQMPIGLRDEEIILSLAVTNPLVHPTMLAKRESMLELGGYRNAPAEDYDLWLRAAKAKAKIVRLKSYGILYRVHPSQMTQQTSWKNQNSNDSLTLAARRELVASYPEIFEGKMWSWCGQSLEFQTPKGLLETWRVFKLFGMKKTIANLMKDNAN